MNWSWRGVAAVAMAIGGAIAWSLWRPAWPQLAYGWLGQELPWLARLLARWESLFALAFCWMLIREPRCGPGLLACWGVYTVITLTELGVGWLVGGLLAVLAGVALAARPWPNRAIMARCAALAGLFLAVDAVAG